MDYFKIGQTKIDQLTELFNTIKIHAAIGIDVHLAHNETDADAAVNCMEEVFSILELVPPEPSDDEIAEVEDEQA